MKNTFTIIFFFFLSLCNSQNRKTIYANQDNKVILIFEDNIKHGIPGNSKDYFFAYNKKTPNKIGTLNAKKGAKPSNLFVVTTNGKMYSFLIQYREKIEFKDFARTIKESSAINNDKTISRNKKEVLKKGINKIKEEQVSKPISTEDYDFHHIEEKTDDAHFLNISKKILSDDKKVFRSELRVIQDVFFSLKGYYYSKEEVYFYFELENKSKLDFDINYLSFFISSKRKRKRSLNQEVFLGHEGKADFDYNIPKRVKIDEKVNFVCSFKKFSVSKKNTLIVRLSELKGEREIELKIPARIINKPQTIKL